MTLQPQRLITVPCTVIARVPAGHDEFGGQALDDVAATARCWYANAVTEETAGQVMHTMTAYFGPDVVLDYVASVEIEGVGVWEVEGTPIAHRSPRTGVCTHQTVRLRRGA